MSKHAPRPGWLVPVPPHQEGRAGTSPGGAGRKATGWHPFRASADGPLRVPLAQGTSGWHHARAGRPRGTRGLERKEPLGLGRRAAPESRRPGPGGAGRSGARRASRTRTRFPTTPGPGPRPFKLPAGRVFSRPLGSPVRLPRPPNVCCVRARKCRQGRFIYSRTSFAAEQFLLQLGSQRSPTRPRFGRPLVLRCRAACRWPSGRRRAGPSAASSESAARRGRHNLAGPRRATDPRPATRHSGRPGRGHGGPWP
jgi:hypothetical protein